MSGGCEFRIRFSFILLFAPFSTSTSPKKHFNSHLADALELPWPSPEATDALGLLREPVVLRGGARSFLSSSGGDSSRWSLDALARRNPTQRVLVRAAPTSSFPVPNGDLLPLVVAAFGTRAAPSLASYLPLREAAERMQAGCPLPPLAYSSSSSSPSFSSFFSSPPPAAVVSDGTEGGRQEWYYIQSQIPREWLEREGSGADSSPLSALLLPDGKGGASLPPRIISQDFRLWLSPRNAVSPLHWDVSSSVLAVLSGVKTFHFWSPEETFGKLEPRGEWSLLRRRCAADPTTPTKEGKGRRRCPPATLRAVVRAGDAVAFPPFWAHHVLSHSEEGDEVEAAGEGGGAGRAADGRGVEVGGGPAPAPTGRPILALTRRASSGVMSQPTMPPRRRFEPTQLLWKGFGVVRSKPLWRGAL